MSKLYVYKQVQENADSIITFISLSTRPPEECSLSGPVECLGTIEVTPLSEATGGET